ncbi:MAG: ABC transporter ATP-binding protein [Chloroflexi bacterium]|nr:ABC transporter ATP-binding protein [Chloroflexota bacterium]
MALIETVDLCHRYDGREVLRNISLGVERGEVLALIGPTGAGKTTFLRLINLLDTPTSGKIRFDGAEIARNGKASLEARRRMGFVFQKPVVFNGSVYDNIACGLRWRGMPGSIVHRMVNNMLETVGLSDYKDRNARTLSGGEMQRVAIARAIVLEPELLLLDEPTANLDPVSTARVEELISGIIQQHKTTVIMATHDMSQGQRLADRIAVFMDGEIRQTGKSGDVFVSPGSREIAEFVGAGNIIEGVVVSSEDNLAMVDAGGKHIEAISDCPVGEKVYACIRPEDITLAHIATATSARNSFSGVITRVTSQGPLARVEIDCGVPLVALVTRRSAVELGLDKGEPVHAAFKATAIHVIRREK